MAMPLALRAPRPFRRAFTRVAVCLSVVVALVGPALVLLDAAPAAASTSLVGELLGSPNNPIFPRAAGVDYGPGDPTGCSSAGTSTASFSGSGPVSGPYPGTISLSGTVSMGPQSDSGQGTSLYGFAARTAAITGITGTFTITSGANTVNGTFTGLNPTPVFFAPNYGSCYGTSGPNAFGYGANLTSGALYGVQATVNYFATVTGPQAGTLTGAAWFRESQTNVDLSGNLNIGHSGQLLQFVNVSDATPPTLAPTVTPNPVVQNGAATANANASDAQSGITSSSCDPVDTSTLGSHSVQCSATNAAGLTATASANYDVIAPPTPGYVVNTTADHADDAGGCQARTASTDCTLREAIGAANAHAGPDQVTFGIPAGQFGEPASPPFTIHPSPDLPWLTDSGTTIDGTTQSEYSGSPVVELAGDGAGAAFGLVALGSNSTIEGLAVNRFSSRGIEVLGGDGSTVDHNYVGTDITGTVDLGNGGDGIDVFGSENNHITNNLASGNGGSGIELRGNNGFEGPAAGNVVTGNLLGTDVTGLVALPNSYGLSVAGNNNTIGGSTGALRNVISGNTAYGVLLGGGTGNHIVGNYIGMKAGGLVTLGNGNNGVEVLHFASGNFIGGLGAGEGNVVTGNGQEGIQVAGPNNQVLGNIVGLDKDGDVAYGNGTGFRGITLSFGEADGNTVAGNTVSGNRIGIQMIAGADGNTVRGNRIGTDLGGTLSRPNVYGITVYGSSNNIIGGGSPGDGNVVANNLVGVLVQDSGGPANGNSIRGNSIHDNGDAGITLTGSANNGQAAPVLADASIAAGTTTVTGTLTSAASTTYRVEVFANSACDGSGHGEGERFVGAGDVLTGGGGVAPIALPVTGVASGEWITVTATAPNGSTSIFSNCRQVHGAPATISVDKVTYPAGSTQAFSFQLRKSSDNSLVDTISGLHDADAAASFTPVLPGTYKVVEAGVNGWSSDGGTCDNTDTPAPESVAAGSLAVAGGEHWTCTFTNTEVGHLHLFKVTDPVVGSPNFEFTGPAPDFPTLLAGGQGSFIDLAPGVAHVISETPKSGWALTDIQCTDPTSDSTTDLANHEISVTLDPGETVNCFFTNSKLGRIEVEKVTDPAGYGGFQFTGDITATLADGDVAGVDVAPGTYRVDETLTGTFPWKGEVDCDDTDSTHAPTASFAPWAEFHVSAGETVRCTFTNYGSAEYAYKVVTNPPGGTDFGFHFEGSPANLIDDGDLSTVSSLAGPARTIRQDLKPGWVVTSIVCDDPAAVPNLADRSATYTLEPGDIVTCTFTNEQVGQLHLHKQTDPDGDSTDFDFTEGSSLVATLADGEDVVVELPAGTHVISETPVNGWAPTDIQCTDPTSDTTPDVANHLASVTLDPGETVDCTFTNSKLGRIEVKKVTDPAGYGGFEFTGDITATLADGEVAGVDVVPGTYHVEEPQSGTWPWKALVSCVDPTGDTTFDQIGAAAWATFQVAAGETVRCTFTNHGSAGYAFREVTNPPGGTGFSFRFAGSSPDLLDDGGSAAVYSLAGPARTIRQDLKPGWVVTSIVCDDPAAVPNLADRSATYTLEPGDIVTCTFTNEPVATTAIIIKMETIGGYGTFNFNADNGLTIPAITTSPGSNPNQTSALPVAPGAYHVSEILPTGWLRTSITCDDANSTVNGATATINVGAGETVTCTWTNTKRGAIVIRKQSVGGTGTFSFSGNLGTTIPALNTATANPNQTAPMPVDPGTYTVSEFNLPVALWRFSGLSCDDGGDSTGTGMTATIRVQPGETVTCTWTNTRRGAIVVRKQSIGGIGTFTYTADNGVTVPNVVTSATANPKSSSPITVDPGTYHVTEAVPSGWDLTGLSCDDGGDSTGSSATATINIQPGETVTCTWVNTKRGTITIRKTSVFGTSTFNYAADNGLTVPDITTTTAGTPKAAPALPVLPGTYHVTESPKTDWTLTDLSCDDADSTESIPTRTATILVAPGENVTCTYENTRTRKADLALAITLPASAGTGLPFTAGLVVTNNGPDVSPGFTVTANLGANVVAGALPAGCLAGGGNTVTCTSTPNLLIGPANAKTFNLTLKNQVTGAACSIWGTAGNDNMTGTGGNDVMCGLGGDDTLNGGGGDDTIYGDIPSGVGNYGTSVSGNVTGPLVDLVPANNSASANTTITLGTPDGDHLTGGGNSDTIFGQEGNDIVTGDVTAVTDTTSGTGDALLDGGVGSDKVYGQGGVDVIQGGPNNDTLNGGAAADTIFGSTGDDNLDGDVGDDDLRGGDNDDIMHGDFGNDTMNGGEGADSMYGDDGNDEISGSDGNDLMFGQGGNDVMNGGEGNDNMTGNNGADAMNGNNGNDTMNGNDGNDTMNGSDGVDTMNGGNDNDTINGNDHNDEIHGNDGRDFLEGGGGTDRVFGDTGNDALHGGTANAGQLNFLDGGTGTDCASAGPDTRTRIEAVNACTAPPP